MQNVFAEVKDTSQKPTKVKSCQRSASRVQASTLLEEDVTYVRRKLFENPAAQTGKCRLRPAESGCHGVRFHEQFTEAVTAGFCGEGEGRSVLGLTLPGVINSYSFEEFLLNDPPHNLTS